LADYTLWRLDRRVLMGGTSLTRAILLALGLCLAAYLAKARLHWVLGLFLGSYFLFSGSMKVALLSLIVMMVVGALGLGATRKALHLPVFWGAVLLALGAAILSQDFANTASRLYQLSLAPEQSQTAPAPETQAQTAQTPPPDTAPIIPIHPDCAAAQSPAFCSSPLVTINDQTERVRLWAHGAALIAKAPLFGQGSGLFNLPLRYEVYTSSGLVTVLNTYTYPHNLFLDVGVTHGLLGLTALLVVLLIGLGVMLSTYARGPAATGLIAAAFAILTSSMTGGDFYDARYLLLLPFIALGFAKDDGRV
jgi:O-Antigen ligase